ncbi:carbonic anhydrase [Thioclava sp. BHET1]|uniref:Carbonic anhydrase n=1 Tax=Thioclava dalianensis TaxID=1185766 RepID=A0A074TDL8_9RHOB|nr:carbonic anhydrase [Thioclava dalianensis]KEP69769.1 carbonic anhydrase [Thioclava dalianensis]TMV94970.1 carbonic anhydrase [Thioclava sp. BHET1]SFM85244.1 carbonic anhydrase [Thioclava dalianensis]
MREHVKPLPTYLVSRYQGWHATSYAENRAWYRRLADEGQRPRSMIIACCDSRVHVSSMFGADQGEFFIHRNIANLVPAFTPDGDHHGTSAAVEYAVQSLKVAHLIVLGHSNCGGVAGCHAMCAGQAPDLEEKSSFTGTWLNILRPGYERVLERAPADPVTELEREAVKVSLENLMTFPFVREALDAERMTLHGLRHEIGEGTLEQYVSSSDQFEPL